MFMEFSLPVITLFLALIAAAAGGVLGDLYGRRTIMLLASVFYVCGPALSALAADFGALATGRAVLGVGVGLSFVSVPTYIAEVAPQDTRGFLVDLADFVVVAGQLLAGIVNGLVSQSGHGWRWSVGLAAVIALVQLPLLLAAPESPRWLLAKGRRAEAEEVLRSLRPAGDEGEASFREELQAALASAEAEKAVGSETWCTSRVRRAIVIGFGLQMLNQLTGINTVMYFGASILVSAGFDQTQSIWLSCLCNFAQVTGVAIQLCQIDTMGRRFTALTSSVGVVLSLLLLGVAFHASNLQWLCVLALMSYLVSFGAGMSGVPYVVNSEIYPLGIRVRCNSFAGVSNWGFNWVVSTTFSMFLHFDLVYAAFFTYAAIGAVGFAWLYHYLPETAHVPLEDIDAFFQDPYPDPKWAALGFFGLRRGPCGEGTADEDSEGTSDGSVDSSTSD
mmetsp:Transcript_33988/g.91101  ORF Transcript_33988/g.91101 Transcript_33988/m.91101 type:complete len:447 (-) Transcript_33988:142-1482(-)